MSDPPLSTMVASEAATPSRANIQVHNAPPTVAAQQASKYLVTQAHDLMICAFFPTPTAPTKFNPISMMTTLLRTMLKDEPSLMLRTPSNDKQLILVSAVLPTGESEFKKYFKVSTPRSKTKHLSHICIGWHVLSDRSLGQIKFQSTNSNLLTWLKKGRVFLESDGLGTDHPVTIGYFTKIDSTITHLANFRNYLVNQLMTVEIDAATAIDLAPHLKQAQIDAMSDGDEFVPILPEFAIYRTRLSHGREPSKVTTEVLGVKCAPRDSKLLSEFFTRMASDTSSDHRDGVFLPKGAVHLLGPQTYEQVLKDNNFFLTTVATILVNLEYEAWFAVIDPSTTSETDPISLHDHLLRKPWFLRIESAAPKKCLIVTTKSNLPEARNWIDANLEPMIRKSIPPGIDPPSSQLPRRLDKPMYSATSQSYADILKKQFSLASTATTPTTVNNRPPRKRQAAIIDYDSDQSADAQPPTTVGKNSSISNNSQPSTATNTSTDYASEILSLKTEINALKLLLTSAVEQFKTAIASSPVATQSPSSNAMDTDVDASTEHPTKTQIQREFADLLSDLKFEIATIVTESRALFKQQLLFSSTNRCNSPPVT